ncbi:MAG: asparagine synthase (glutamine-hydrolyzing) [Blastomonas fulva]|uniref:asparagine synthase (glutamine-hydrolyzing) n=1 Tax=Blastomonas fulva TaxID=1550728 RepID=UPI004034AC9D
MCGIVGLLSADAPDRLASRIAAMNAAIVHRGPDDAGVHLAPGLALAMRRLAIIDLSTGHQPMMTSDGVTIVFNGEIYNFQSLRAELESRGYVFRTRSDTEVILNLYHAEGVAAFARLHGMFAIAIHDPRSNELILARDQVGIKPLYIAEHDGEFLFASEIKAILAALPGRPAINPQAVWDYLSLRFMAPDRTIWVGIGKLGPGQMLRRNLGDGRQTIETYWRVDLTPGALEPGRDYAREFADQFIAAVDSHIIAADVPVGAFLSGGLDSGAIVAAASELGHRDFHTFSISGDGAGGDDELPLARAVAERFGTTHHEIRMARTDYFDALDDVVRAFDEPYGDATGAALYLLSCKASEHVKVAMSGEGADELLLGYTRATDLATLAKVERRYGHVPRSLLGLAARFVSPDRASILRAMAKGGPGAYRRGMAAHIGWTISDAEKAAFWRGPPMVPSFDLVQGWYSLADTVNPLAQSQQADFGTWLVEDLLMKADKMAMAASLETRVPFLHLPLVEWCQKTPMEARIGAQGQFRTKAVLRDFVATRLPDAVLNAPKRGFPLPIFPWFAERLRDAGGYVPVSREFHNWISLDGLQPIVARACANERRALEQLWGIAMFDRWCAAYAD